MTSNTFNAKEYLNWDYSNSLLPLEISNIVSHSIFDEILQYINQKILDEKQNEYNFSVQKRTYAAKGGYHLRRTHKLDPIAEVFIYEIVHRNRGSFRKDHTERQRSFGYRFSKGEPIAAKNAYLAYKTAVSDARKQFKYSMSFDIASCFNSIYHHDLVNHFREIGWSDRDCANIGLFFRQINSGVSIDCLPQGIHPCKVLGSEFLRFLDNNGKLSSGLMIRFMDDINLFSDNESNLIKDFLYLQEILGDKGLFINPLKTIYSGSESKSPSREIDKIKEKLLNKRRLVLSNYDSKIVSKPPSLTSKEVEYLIELIGNSDLEEADAELALVLLRNYSEKIESNLIQILQKFPSLSRNVHNFIKHSTKIHNLEEIILEFLSKSDNITEYQLFWLAKICEDFLILSKNLSAIIWKLLEHENATDITKAKILEIPENRFGLPELRKEQLRSGDSNWLSWSSAVGSRKEKPATRNHTLTYFANSSLANKLIADAVKKYP